MDLDIFCREQSAADALVEGFYLHRRHGCVSMPVRIWFGPPKDPHTGEEMDRSWRWQVELAGELVEDWSHIWPRCGREPVTRQEHDYRVARVKYARAHDPEDPFGAVDGRFDPLTVALPFGD